MGQDGWELQLMGYPNLIRPQRPRSSNPFRPVQNGFSSIGNNQAEGASPLVLLVVNVNGIPKLINITNISNTSPVVVTAKNSFNNGQSILMPIVPGVWQLSSNLYYIGNVTTTTFSLYLDAARTKPVNGTTMSPFIMDSISANGNSNSNTREVPVVYDSISGTWVAPLSKVNQEEREMGLEVARLTMEDQTFLGAIGYNTGNQFGNDEPT